MTDVSLMAVRGELQDARCANCGAELVADQRYCLSCGQPVSPVRLSFLDVLQSDAAPQPQPWVDPYPVEPAAYAPPPAAGGAAGWIRRNSGFVSLVSVLLMCLIIGLLIGHWVTQKGTTSTVPTGPLSIKVEGLGSIAPTAGTDATSSTGGSAESSSVSATQKKEEAEEAHEAAEEEKAPKTAPAKAVTVTPSKLQKLSTSTGKKHTEEINALGSQPIETG